MNWKCFVSKINIAILLLLLGAGNVSAFNVGTDWTNTTKNLYTTGIAEIGGGHAQISVDTLADLKALNITLTRKSVYVRYRITPGDGGHGHFRWDASDLNIQVAADTLSGIYVPPNSDTTGASGAWVRQYVGPVNVAWWGAVGDGVTDSTAAIQAPLTASQLFEIEIPSGNYLISSTLIIDNKVGLSIKGVPGNDKASLLWSGDPGGIMLDETRSRNLRISGISLVGSVSGPAVASTGLRITSGAGNTNTQHIYQDIYFNRFTGRAVDLVGNNWQLDLIHFKNCFWGDSDEFVHIEGASTLNIHFDGGTLGTFTSYGFRFVTGGTVYIRNMGFIYGGTPGEPLVGSPWVISRARTFGEVNVENCQLEGNTQFLTGEDDSGGAQTTTVTVRNCTIGVTAGGNYSVIDYRQRGQFIWEGGNIGNAGGGTVIAYFAKPGSAGDGGNIYINGVKNDGTVTVTISGNTYITGYDKNGTMQAGHGLKFPVTTVEVVDVNTLDDYKEGTWTPVVYGSTGAGIGTYTEQVGTYVKVGKMVMVSGQVGWSAHTGTGNLRISGLPYNAGSRGIATVYANGLTYSGSNLQPFMNDTELWLSTTSTGAGDSYVAMDAAATIWFTVMYKAP